MNASERLTTSLWPNPDNPRRDIRDDPDFAGFVASIRSEGIIQPLLIRDDGMIWAGHRRLEAALEVGLERVPVMVLADSDNRVLIPLIENLQRSDLDVLEVAEYLKQCRRAHGMTLTAISEVTGISASTIGKYIKLAEAPLELPERIDRDEIPLTAAFELLRHDEAFIKDVVATPRLTKKIVRERAQRVSPVVVDHEDSQPRISGMTTGRRQRCPTERHAHLRHAITTVEELLCAAPDEAFAARYTRWLNLMKTDLAEYKSALEDPTFRGAVNAFQRQPLIRTRA